MKLPTSNVHTESSNILKSYKYGIRDQDTGLILDILRKKMYRDPIKAFCREISCNARDAHTEFGTPDKPVKIVLPNAFEPTLKIQDFGPGIDPKRIADIFVNFGASTKRQDNTQIGGFGLGAKTPFAYGDTFTVVTIHDGKKRTYAAYIDESERGKLDLLREEDTKEHTGTTISIPVKKDDCKHVIAAITEATTYWKIKPITSGAKLAWPSFGKVMLSDEDWTLFSKRDSSQYHSSQSKAVLIIDGVGYDCSSKDLGIDYDPYRYGRAPKKDKVIGSLLYRDLHLHFPVGELNLASNRDNIHFDERTQKVILDRLHKVIDALYQHAVDKIQKFDNIVDAELFWEDFKKEVPSVGANKSPTWKDIELSGLTRKVLSKAGSSDSNAWFKKAHEGARIECFYWYHKTYRTDNYRQEWIVRKTNTTEVQFSSVLGSKIQIYINDLGTKRAPRARVIELMENSCKNKVGYKIEADITKVYVLSFFDSSIEKYWLDDLHFKYVKTKKVSELPETKRDLKKYEPKSKRVKREDFDAWKMNADGYWWDKCIVPKDSGEGTYVEVLNKRDDRFNAGSIKYSDTKMCLLSKLLGEPIYGIPTKKLHMLGPKWKKVDEVAIPALKKALNKFDLDKARFYRREHDFHCDQVMSYAIKSIDSSKLKQDSEMLKYILRSKKITKLIEECDFKIKLVHQFDNELGLKKLNNKKAHNQKSQLEQISKKVQTLYPLLFNLNWYSDMGDAIMNYISMVDEQEANKKSIVKVA